MVPRSGPGAPTNPLEFGLFSTPTAAEIARLRENTLGTRPICTTPDRWAAILTEFTRDERFDTINLIPEKPDAEQIHRFATEVIPAAPAATT